MRISIEFPPPDIVVRAINAASTRVEGRIEIYEQDGLTRWVSDKIRRLIDGSVNVDYTRDERRTCDLTLDNSDNVLINAPGYFWYDKVIKVFKRVNIRTSDFDGWECQIGEFMIDAISEANFPHQTSVTLRDYTKKCINSKFVVTTQFSDSTLELETLIGAIAANAGIVKMILPATGIKIGRTFSYEPDTPRWDALKEIANAYNYDVFFDPQGYLRLAPFADPYLQNATSTFLTGSAGNLSSFNKNTDDSRLYNHVLVLGATDGNNPPIWAEAKNENPSSPTCIDEIGDRLFTFQNDLIFLRTNYYINPSIETSLGGIIGTPGTGGIAVLTQQTDSPAGSSGTKCARYTWSTATTVVSGGLGTDKIKSIPGDEWSVRLWVKTNHGGQVVAPRFSWRDKKDVLLSTDVGAPVILAANQWTEIILDDGIVAPANTNHFYFRLWSDATGANWAIGDWLEWDNILIENDAKIGPYFDGDSYACDWFGAVGISKSLSNRMAQDVADSFLSIHQLEQFSLDMTTLNLFYLDAGNIIEFIDPRPAPGDPTKFLLQTMDIPVGVGTMEVTAARIANVGGT